MHAELRHILLRKYFCYFTASICTEIKTYYRIAGFNITVTILNGSVNNGFDKFIRYICRIRCFNGFDKVGAFFSNAIYKRIICQLHSFPSFIAIHCIIPAHNTGNLSGSFIKMILQVFDIA